MSISRSKKMDWMIKNQARASPSEDDDDDEACFTSASCLSSIDAFHQTLSASLQLGLFDIIAEAGPNAKLTPTEITAQLATKNPHASSMIDRMLRLLSCYSLLTCSIRNLDEFQVERSYGLSPTGQYFVTKKDGVSLATFSSFGKSPVLNAWSELKNAVIEGGIPYERAYGVPRYEQISSDQESIKGFSKAMDTLCSYLMEKVLEKYNGFHGLRSLVDVGGGSGLALNMIVSKYPSILGINFDLPHVVDQAPSYPGIKHVGGDMFLGVPSGDAIMMKAVLHNWSDEQCYKILKKCYDALPSDGKVIVISFVMPEELDPSPTTKFVCHMDITMYLIHGGKQRTEREFKALGMAAGFSGFQLICHAAYHAVLEFYK